LRALEALCAPQCTAVNLGTGIGYSVLDVLKAFETGSSKTVAYEILPRRAGDIAACFANPLRALELLGWSATKTLDEMCADTWHFQTQNPNGYTTKESK
jgi:UDP-glucose 4-epimerase